MKSTAVNLNFLLLPIRTVRSLTFGTCKLFFDSTNSSSLTRYRLDYEDTIDVESKGIVSTIRSVFVINPKKTIRLILQYPASIGRNTAEILRAIDALLANSKHLVATPIDWVPGDDVIVHQRFTDEEAKIRFPNFRFVRPYLRFTSLPKDQM